MTERTDIEMTAVNRFLETGFDEDFSPKAVSRPESKLIEKIVEHVAARFGSHTYVLGLALDFAMVAQKLSEYDPDAKEFRGNLTEDALFARYPRRSAAGTQNVNTLTLNFRHNNEVKRVGIRRVEEDVCDLFIAADRTGYPSAYVYNTGMWHHYPDLLVDCFKLSESGRYTLFQRLIDFGLERLPKNTFYGRETPRVRLFERIIQEYPRTANEAENAGMVMQGIAYGFIKADRPHLSLIAEKSRFGSKKQRRFGDIDGYYGLDLEISVEVKDELITNERVESELGEFARDVQRHRAQGLALVLSADQEAVQWLDQHGVVTQDIEATLSRVASWDWRKQDDAVHGLLHFLAHVEAKPESVDRLLRFIQERDAGHDSLAYLKDDDR